MTGTRNLIGTAIIVLAATGAILPATVVAAPANAHSSSFAGYQLAVAPTTASATFKLPSLTCTATDAGMVAAVVFTNFTTSEFTSGGAYSNCTGGQAGYAALAEINDHFSYLTQAMSAGDTIKVTVKVSSSKTTVSITDKTTRSTVTDTVTGSSGGGAFTGFSVGESKIGSPNLPVPQFVALAYSGITVNGAALGSYSAGSLVASDMYDGTTLQVSTGALAAGSGSFTTHFQHT